ncbi:hypothetical protein RHS01_03149 [Rhizoctonia solani]|uniref:Uncharacterized protein n=1 Tax=Rhizoctonia solani TaxID=456999 RepID=A0A8H7IJ59_9AGAM|nr:hypothetical protein RHS01_03149 [Rhizoctonia solani]
MCEFSPGSASFHHQLLDQIKFIKVSRALEFALQVISPRPPRSFWPPVCERYPIGCVVDRSLHVHPLYSPTTTTCLAPGPHYHQGSANLCHCAFSESYHNTSAPYIYPSAPAPAPPPAGRPRPIAGHPSEYAPAIRRVPKPKPTNKIAKSRDMKFDEDTWQWYFETADAPGVRWLESVRHIEDLPQAKDPDFASMLNEYYMAGHVIDMPDQERLPVVPGGLGKGWRYKRAAPPPAVQKQPTQHPPAPAQPQTWIEPIYHQRYPAAPQYAGGSAHPVSMRPNHDGWRRLGPLPGTPGPRHYVDASAHRGYRPPSPDDSPSEESEDEEDEDEDDESDDSYNYPELHRSRSYAPPHLPSLHTMRKD